MVRTRTAGGELVDANHRAQVNHKPSWNLGHLNSFAGEKMSDKYHFRIRGKYIQCWNGNDGWTRIATAHLERPCRHLIRHVQLAEDVERLMDNYAANLGRIAPDVRHAQLAEGMELLMSSFLADTSGIAPAKLAD